MNIVRRLGFLLAMAAAAIACSVTPNEDATGRTESANSTCSSPCTTAWTDCQPLPNKRTVIMGCVACGAQGEPVCDTTGPDPGCQGLTGGYLGPVNGLCEQCGQAAGQPACGGVTGYCAPWNPNLGYPIQPLDPVNGVCQNCGNINQLVCKVGGSRFCEVGVNDGTKCIACSVGEQSPNLCGASHCNDGSCQPGIVSSCPIAGGSWRSVKCADGCGDHGGVDSSVGCSIQAGQ